MTGPAGVGNSTSAGLAKVRSALTPDMPASDRAAARPSSCSGTSAARCAARVAPVRSVGAWTQEAEASDARVSAPGGRQCPDTRGAVRCGVRSARDRALQVPRPSAARPGAVCRVPATARHCRSRADRDSGATAARACGPRPFRRSVARYGAPERPCASTAPPARDPATAPRDRAAAAACRSSCLPHR